MEPITSDMELDLSHGWLAELVDLEERLNADAPERFNEYGKPIDPARWIWKLQLIDPETGDAVVRQGKRGGTQPVEVWLFSSRSTYYDPQGVYTARARTYMHALSGQVLRQGDVRELLEESGLPFGLCGRRCLVFLTMRTGSDGRQRLSVNQVLDMEGTVWWAPASGERKAS